MRNRIIGKSLILGIIVLFVGAIILPVIVGSTVEYSFRINTLSDNPKYLDLAIPNYVDDDICILFGDGNGGFGDRQDYSVGNGPEDVVTGDFNNDTFLDLATINFYDNDVCIHIGDGYGYFEYYQDYSVGDDPNGIVTGDFNNDTFLDLAIINKNDDDLSVLLGNGSGGFGERKDFFAGDRPEGIVSGDFNMDNILDLATTNAYDNDMSVLLGYGNGSFMTRQVYSTGFGPEKMVTGDFNNDTFLDLATANRGSDSVSIFLGYGNGSFEDHQEYSVGDNPEGIVTGDFNNDTFLDLAVTNDWDYDISVLLGDGDGGFGNRQDYAVGEHPIDISAADFDRDNILDLVVVNMNDDTISILIGNGNGGFGDRQDYGVGDAPRAIAIGYFNQEVNSPPNEPSDPDPQDGTTDVTINTNLSWTGGDPDGDEVTYDIYFGTSTPPPKVVSNQSSTTYDPGLLDFDTLYYWRIVAWDEFENSAVGPIWVFTTEENLPPYEPSDPNPPDGATDVTIYKILSWTGGDPNIGDPVIYDVYLGDSSPPPLVAEDLTYEAYDPGTMELGTTYYWQIISEDSGGLTTEGPIWSFTTEEEPNEPPTAPDIDGPSKGKPGKEICWTFHSDDPNDDDVKYIIDWGDENSEETDYYPSCTPAEACHTYDEEGTYIIKAMAEDIKEARSDESTFEVEIPRTRATYYTLFYWLLERFPLLERLLNLFM